MQSLHSSVAGSRPTTYVQVQNYTCSSYKSKPSSLRTFSSSSLQDIHLLSSSALSRPCTRFFSLSCPCPSTCSCSLTRALLLFPGSLKTTSTFRCTHLRSPSCGGAWVRSDWRCLAMAVSGPQDSTPSGVTRRVEIVNTTGEKLAGILDDTKSKELVVLCHGFRSSKDSNTLGGIAAAILKTGISAFRFDFSGNGESEGEFAYGNYWRETEDLRSVILYWRAEGRQVTAILGHSKGGNVVVLYAAKYGDVSTVINVSGRFDLTVGTDARFGKKGMEKLHEQGFLDVKNKLTGEVEYRVTLKSLEDRLTTDMDGAARSISTDVRVLTIHGEVDEIVAVSDAYEFAKRIPNHVLKIIDGGNHNYEGSQNDLSTLVVEFLQGKLSKM